MEVITENKKVVFLIAIIFLFHSFSSIAQNTNTIPSHIANRMGESVKDENGNTIYRIEESSRYGYIFELKLNFIEKPVLEKSAW
jgi:hypothetical protein